MVLTLERVRPFNAAFSVNFLSHSAAFCVVSSPSLPSFSFPFPFALAPFPSFSPSSLGEESLILLGFLWPSSSFVFSSSWPFFSSSIAYAQDKRGGSKKCQEKSKVSKKAQREEKENQGREKRTGERDYFFSFFLFFSFLKEKRERGKEKRKGVFPLFLVSFTKRATLKK